jgi:polar amino acid transport system substrate-binding protein
MARTRRIFATLATASIVLAACGGGGGDGESDGGDEGAGEPTPIESVDLTFQPIVAGKLTVCSDAPYEPFQFEETAGSSNWTGFDVDLMKAVATRYGLAFELVVTTGDQLVPKLLAASCDIVASALVITPELQETVAISDSYFDSYPSLLVRKGDAETLNAVETLAGKKVGVMADSAGARYMETSESGATVQTFEDTEEMYAALEAGTIDGVVHDFAISAFRALKKGDVAVSTTFQEEIEQFGFAIDPKKEDFLLAVNESLNEFNATGVYQDIYDKYFASTIVEEGE